MESHNMDIMDKIKKELTKHNFNPMYDSVRIDLTHSKPYTVIEIDYHTFKVYNVTIKELTQLRLTNYNPIICINAHKTK